VVRCTQLNLFIGNYISEADAFVALERRSNGNYAFSPQSQIGGRLRMEKIDLAFLASMLNADLQLTGETSYDIRWRGTLQAPHVEGSFTLQNGSFSPSHSTEVFSGIHAEAVLQDSVLVLEEMSGTVRDIGWQLLGRVELLSPEEFNLEFDLGVAETGSVRGEGNVAADSLNFNIRMDNMNLGVLQPFIPGIEEFSGTSDVRMLVRGPLISPDLQGEMTVQHLTFSIPVLQEKVENALLSLSFNEKKVVIDSARAAFNGGMIMAHGELSHDNGKLMNASLQMRLKDLAVQRKNEFTLLITDAQLKYKKNTTSALLEGDVILGDSRLIRRFSPQNFISFTRSVERPKPQSPQFMKETRLDIRLRDSDNIWIDNNLARLRLHSELSFIGTLAQPNLAGRLRAEEGYVLYLDRKFKITDGVLDFIDPNTVNPIVDVESETVLRTYQTLEKVPYTISFSVRGPVRQAEVSLNSNPPLDNADIVALLTVGTTRRKLSGSAQEVTVADVLRERAELYSSQRISGYASRKVGSLLGLEEMSIEGNLFQFGRSWGPQLIASKEISDRLILDYKTTVGHLNEQSIRLRYQWSKYFSLQGQTDQKGRSALDLLYGVKF
jgi:autotransporter translocation and assembly factor TamB